MHCKWNDFSINHNNIAFAESFRNIVLFRFIFKSHWFHFFDNKTKNNLRILNFLNLAQLRFHSGQLRAWSAGPEPCRSHSRWFRSCRTHRGRRRRLFHRSVPVQATSLRDHMSTTVLLRLQQRWCAPWQIITSCESTFSGEFVKRMPVVVLHVDVSGLIH